MRAWRFLLAALSMIAVVATASAARVPDFTFTTDRGPLKLQDLRGKVVYLDYWASWCGPCRQTFPFMNELHARYRDKDWLSSPSPWIKTPPTHVASSRNTLPTSSSPMTPTVRPRALRVKGMPTSFVIDQSGEMVATHIGFNEADKGKIEREN